MVVSGMRRIKRGRRKSALGWGGGGACLNGWPGKASDGKAASEIRAKLVECVPGRGLPGQKPGEGRGVAGPDGMGPHGSWLRLWVFSE